MKNGITRIEGAAWARAVTVARVLYPGDVWLEAAIGEGMPARASADPFVALQGLLRRRQTVSPLREGVS